MSGAKPEEPNVRPIEWFRMGARVQAHGMCQYCDRRAEFMKKVGSGKRQRWVALCPAHAEKK